MKLPNGYGSVIRLYRHRRKPYAANTEDLGAKVALILCYTGLRPTELAQIKIADIDLAGRHMKGGINTKAGKNRLVPIAEKIFPLVESFYNPAN